MTVFPPYQFIFWSSWENLIYCSSVICQALFFFLSFDAYPVGLFLWRDSLRLKNHATTATKFPESSTLYSLDSRLNDIYFSLKCF